MKTLSLSVFIFLVTVVSFSQNGLVQVQTGSTTKINAVFFVNANLGFLACDSGKIMKTTNGGINWTKLKPIPVFKTEDEEREFWNKADSSQYFDWSTAQRVVFPNLKYSTESISLRMPSSILDRIKAMANERDVPYQSLIKMILQTG